MFERVATVTELETIMSIDDVHRLCTGLDIWNASRQQERDR